MTTAPTAQHDAITALEDAGLRITGQRRQVVAAVERRDGGFTAEDISGQLPGVGRATVFRTLKLLVNADVICKLALPDGTPIYSPSRVEHHHHSVCTTCGAIEEFRDTTVERVLRSLTREIEGEIVGHRMEVFIRCGSCLNSQAV
ncbi:MAG TPA: Fur family transcriptional regulator [Dehalococcoidia bacterium]|jgi:Fe2+ or Zn2+ uptake regulation protein|nr:transcriptional repressor [Chloroflexota bacterium]MDP5876349.1 Fur family transcriptional regulator [Dehalococcoidia bacterium]MDP6273724.1 Fur family transcriptional regulator [Dehalococcoidia bacterium]MDP7161716.1 Fur family transcriptional regulator [Dehalococcoidia bacterium]MDP7212551.1 Fur family transcriptional regulator [Dehalococcoidia bacterium]|tara:strand:+ start:761 stop:1195 length:435 start_codon:yes stop_codon:yes gene_type:complete